MSVASPLSVSNMICTGQKFPRKFHNFSEKFLRASTHIFELDVTMSDTELVAPRQSGGDLSDDLSNHLFGQWPKVSLL